MNERIKSLLVKAHLDVMEDLGDIDSNHVAEKFAELIIQECVKFCEHESNDDDHDEYDMGMWVKAESIKTAIKQHFGVEE